MRGARGVSAGGSMYAKGKNGCGGWLSITALKAERRSWCIVRQTRGAVRETRSVGGAQRKAVRPHYEIRLYAHDGRGAGADGPGISRRLDRERRKAVRLHSEITPYAHYGRGAAAAGPGMSRQLDRGKKQFDHILKSGRTRMMGAVPVRLGGEFWAIREGQAEIFGKDRQGA